MEQMERRYLVGRSNVTKPTLVAKEEAELDGVVVVVVVVVEDVLEVDPGNEAVEAVVMVVDEVVVAVKDVLEVVPEVDLEVEIDAHVVNFLLDLTRHILTLLILN